MAFSSTTPWFIACEPTGISEPCAAGRLPRPGSECGLPPASDQAPYRLNADTAPNPAPVAQCGRGFLVVISP